MSWEVMSEEIKTCNCGKGTVKVVCEMDDFNRMRDREIIYCKSCNGMNGGHFIVKNFDRGVQEKMKFNSKSR